MRIPKAVVFDLGKVLVDFDYQKAAHAVGVRSRMTPAQVMEHFGRSPLLAQYETGLISDSEFYSQVRAITGYSGSFEEFGVQFGDIFSPIDRMIELHSALVRRAVPTYVFSNTNGLAVRHIRGAYPFFKLFSGYILSFEQRAMKPDPAIYQVVEKLSACSGPDLLYLDDREENLATAENRGWQVVLHTAPEQSWEAVRRSGLLPANS